MACIDKTYADHEQYELAKRFWEGTVEQQRKELGSPIDLCERDSVQGVSILWNTSVIEDIWLKKYCNIDFILNRIEAQYGTSTCGLSTLAQHCDFTSIGLVIGQIKSSTGKLIVDLFYDTGEDQYVFDEKDTILNYGTTLLHKTLYDAKEAISGYTCFDGTIKFNYWGADLFYNKGTLTIDGTEQVVNLGYLSEEDFKLPNIKHSYDSKEVKRSKIEAIFISSDDEVIPLLRFKGIGSYTKTAIMKGLQHGRFHTPNYIKIK